jgi:hypothetical protein
LEGVVRHMERYTARHPDALLIVNATGCGFRRFSDTRSD